MAAAGDGPPTRSGCHPLGVTRTRALGLAVLVAFALAGCPSTSAQSQHTDTTRVLATTIAPGTVPATTLPTTTTVPTLVAAAVPPGCRDDFYGEDAYNPPSQLIECPASGPVGTVVTLSGAGCTFPGRGVRLKFFGPIGFQGSGGAGVSVFTSG